MGEAKETSERQFNPSDRIEYLAYPEMGLTNQEGFDRVRQVIEKVYPHYFYPSVSRHIDVSNNNVLFFPHPQIPEDISSEPHFVMKIAGRNQFTKREETAFNLLSKFFEKFPNNQILIPVVIKKLSSNEILTTEHISPNLSKEKYPNLYLDMILNYFLQLQNAKKTKELEQIFPYENFHDIGTPTVFVQQARKKEDILRVYVGKLAEGESYAEDDGELLFEEIKKNEILEKMARERTKVENDPIINTSITETLCFDTGDTSPSNIIFHIDQNNNATISPIDMEYAEFLPQIFSVAKFVEHPDWIKTIPDPKKRSELLNSFLMDYIQKSKLNHEQITLLNTFLKVSHYSWEATIAKNIALKKNWKEIFGGVFLNRVQAVRTIDLPILVNMLDNDSLQVPDDPNDPVYGYKHLNPELDIQALNPAFKSRGVVSSFDTKLAETVTSEWYPHTTYPIKDAGLIPPDENEIFNTPPFIWGGSSEVTDLDDFKIVKIPFGSYFFTASSESPTPHTYYYLDQETNRNIKLFNLNDDEIVRPIEKAISIDISNDLVQKIQSMPGTEKFVENLTSNISYNTTSDKVSIKIVGVDIYDKNSKYYNVFIFKTEDGKEIPVVRNGRNDDGSIFIVLNDNKELEVIRNVRLPIKRNESMQNGGKISLEIPRGFSSGEKLSDELFQETGLRSAEYSLEHLGNLIQDPTDFNYPDVYLISKHPAGSNKSDKLQHPDPFDLGTEAIRRGISLSNHEVLTAIAKGHINCSISISALAINMLNQNSITIKNDVLKQNVRLVSRYRIQHGKYMLELPDTDNIDSAVVGKHFPDTGKSRIQKNVILNGNIINKNDDFEQVVNLPLTEILDKMRSFELDSSTVTELFLGLISIGAILEK